MTDQDPSHDRPAIPRRALLFGTGALGVGGLLGRDARAGAVASSGTRRVIDPEAMGLFQGGCTLTASDVQGPFWLDLGLVRQDITEGYPGVPLRIYLRIHSAATCGPIEGAVVDVWHCEAQGSYSGFQSRGTQGLTFLRGIQITDASGLCFFDTIYPGWYTGRTPHIHVKVTPQAGSQLTTQFYFPQSVNDRVFSLPPYDQHGPAPTTNSTDAFYAADREFELRRDPSGNGILGGMTIVVA